MLDNLLIGNSKIVMELNLKVFHFLWPNEIFIYLFIYETCEI